MIGVLLLAAATVTPIDYRHPDTWLCRPGHDLVCTRDQDATLITANGKRTMQAFDRARSPRADCFYIYPTVSLDASPNSDMVPDIQERGMVAAQFGRFASICRAFAPLYRQVTLTALRGMMRGGANVADGELAYADVRAAWRDYLAHDNRGRPFALIGHSQGSAMLKRLIVEEIDGKPIQRHMLSAILPGTSVAVPDAHGGGGGTFRAIPACEAETQTGCVISWASYRNTIPPPANALFGTIPEPGTAALCSNPARLGGGDAALDSYLGFPWWQSGVAKFIPPPGTTIPGRFVHVHGLLTGVCVKTERVSYLKVRVATGFAGLGDELAGPAPIGDTDYPEWGFHVVDLAIVQGDLIRLIGAQIRALERARK